MITPLKDRNADTFRYLAKEDSTVVSINGNVAYILNAGEFAEDTVANQKIISSNKTFAVFQYSNGQYYDNTFGDPFMIQLRPSHNIIYKSVFKTYTAIAYLHYVNIITKNILISTVYLNGINIPTINFTPISNSGYSHASLAIPDTTNILQSDSGFIAYQYGLNYNLESYGYALSGYTSNLSTSLNEILHHNFQLNIYPNPFNKETLIKLPFAPVNNTGFAFVVYDESGKEVRRISEIKTSEFIFYRNNLSEGMYFYKLFNEDEVLSSGELIIINWDYFGKWKAKVCRGIFEGILFSIRNLNLNFLFDIFKTNR